ncbi:MAG: DUF1559 domain-containing protein, partial [Planctomycetota bacterium]
MFRLIHEALPICRALPRLAVLTLLLVGSSLFAQTSEKLSSRYIPGNALAATFVFPSELLDDPSVQMLPIEVAEAATMENVGVELRDLEEIKLVVGMPSPAGPVGGLVVSLAKGYSFETLSPKLTESFERGEENGLVIYTSRQQPVVRVYQPDPQTMLIGMGGYLDAMIDAADGGEGKLPDLVSKLSRRKGTTAIAVLEQLRPMITPMLQQQQPMLPPQLQDAVNVAEYTDAVLINADFSLSNGSTTLSFLGKDEASAERIETLINDSLDFASTMIIAQAKKEFQGDSAMDRAMIKYIERMGQQVPEMIRPKRRGDLVQVKTEMETGVATTGVLVGMLLPAVQAARSAARRMSGSNNLKQIALAYHNYHSAYRVLPANITDEDGNPLLSWRVAILPFIEEQELYEQFHLDEPWDSAHNSSLIAKMPAVYSDPATSLPQGLTIYQRPVGEKTMFQEGEERRFRDVLDGLSNTIMGMEVAASSAVEWTKPS